MSRTIAVTGATGFIGAMLVDHLLAAGWNVNALIMQSILTAADGSYWAALRASV